jgi:hypothetical protein
MERLAAGGGSSRERGVAHRMLPWIQVEPVLTGTRLEWSKLDAPVKGRPAMPAQVGTLSDGEEVDAIMSGWR